MVVVMVRLYGGVWVVIVYGNVMDCGMVVVVMVWYYGGDGVVVIGCMMT
jgi:hypothetical protein